MAFKTMDRCWTVALRSFSLFTIFNSGQTKMIHMVCRRYSRYVRTSPSYIMVFRLHRKCVHLASFSDQLINVENIWYAFGIEGPWDARHTREYALRLVCEVCICVLEGFLFSCVGIGDLSNMCSDFNWGFLLSHHLRVINWKRMSYS